MHRFFDDGNNTVFNDYRHLYNPEPGTQGQMLMRYRDWQQGAGWGYCGQPCIGMHFA